MDEKTAKKVFKNTVDTGNGFVKGNKLYHGTQGYKYKVKFDTSPVCKVNVIDQTAMSARNAARAGGRPGDWVFRIDTPHRGAEFNHVNINPSISGVPDPHLKLPPGGVTAAKGTAKFCQAMNKVNKVAVPLAIAVDTVRTGVAVYEDVENGTSRNTVETVASVAGGWGGGYGGAVGGAAIGSAIMPGIGTIIGGIVGGIGGGIGGSLGASYVAETIGDEAGYDVVKKYCQKCGKKFLVRLYQGERNQKYCPKCA